VASGKPGFFEELKRRHVWRIAVGYAIAAWLLVQIATQVFPFFNIPNWSVRLVVVVLAIGFPAAVICAWVYEITPEGVRRTEPADSPGARPEFAERQIARKLNIVIVAALIVAVALLGWRLLVLRDAVASKSPAATVVQTAPATSSSSRSPAPSIAAKAASFHPPADTLVVLPFQNLGGDPKEQYFSDGITEELTNALGQNTALRVIAWDTASKYRDNGESAADIGKALNVANVLTGKILRQGDEVRVIVELVSAVSGYQLWSNHYDDNLKNIFAVQDTISQSIASALKVKFASAGAAPVVNPEAHDLVLKGRAALDRARTAETVELARKDFERAIALEPNYAEAHAGLARAWLLLTQFGTLPPDEAVPRMRAEATRALALDPRNVEALVQLANADATDRQIAKAKVAYERALEIDPSNAGAHMDYALALPLEQNLAQTQEAVMLDPDSATAQGNLADTYLDLGQYAQALPPADTLMKLAPDSPDSAFTLALVYRLLHQNEAAMRAFDLAQPSAPQDKQLVAAGKLAYQSLLDPGLRSRALAAMDAMRLRGGLAPYALEDLAELYVMLGEKDVAVDLLRGICAGAPAACTDLASNPPWRPLRSNPKFEALVRKYDTMSE